MKFSRQGKLIITTADPVCAAQILNLDKIQETPVSTGVTFENITERFLVFDIPTNLQLSELADEIMNKNDMEVVELRLSVFHQTDLKKSPNRKRQMINLVPPTNTPMQWDAGGSNASN
ncbi:uncharacterized protein CEXT_725231 [Caerostris extrusa]|uniref:Uncharacterized protein n=1 Tax=Caerostris extrusa TaxID=172846 RepID=A0AAV4NN84_CAEEX|nr:uncharacterized protein CEXT_725231 [Caerostris extrusa]